MRLKITESLKLQVYLRYSVHVLCDKAEDQPMYKARLYSTFHAILFARKNNPGSLQKLTGKNDLL